MTGTLTTRNATLTGLALAATVAFCGCMGLMSMSTTWAATPSVKESLKPKPVLNDTKRQEIQADIAKLPPETQQALSKLSQAMHDEDSSINNELRDEETQAFSDIGMLWSASVERSGTIRYAIEKLSRRDATGKPAANDAFSHRMLQSLVHLGGVAGTMWTGTPAGLIGSNMLQGMMTGNPQDSALSRVTDADMVILAKEVDSLQTHLIELYYNYRHSKERLTLSHNASSTLSTYYDQASKASDSNSVALQPLMQSLEASAQQDEHNAQQAYNSARTELGLLVGPDAMKALDTPSEKEKTSSSSSTTSQ